jgi:hypothetical protein
MEMDEGLREFALRYLLAGARCARRVCRSGNPVVVLVRGDSGVDRAVLARLGAAQRRHRRPVDLPVREGARAYVVREQEARGILPALAAALDEYRAKGMHGPGMVPMIFLQGDSCVLMGAAESPPPGFGWG